MTPRAAATIGVRIVALWLLVGALLSAVGILVVHFRSSSEAPSFAGPLIWSLLPKILLDLLGALILFIFSKPIGRLIGRRIE